MRNFFYLLPLLALLISGCDDDDDPVIPNEEELITTMTYTLTATGAPAVVLSFVDLDGDGGDAPVITGGTLAANTTYQGSITLANEQETPAEDITAEVREEDEEHQFFFSSTVPGLDLDYADADAEGNPVGLLTLVTTAAAGTGNLTVTLRHEPQKAADGVAAGDITNAGGETDIEVVFPITVQ